VYGTTEFLTLELAKVAEELSQSESQLQALKGRYRYALPSELDTNLRTLDRLQDQKQSNIEALDRYVSLKLNLEQQLSEIPAEIPREQAIRATGNTTVDPAVQAYRQKEREYKELIARAKETHPEVRRLKAELEELKKDLPEAELNNTSENPLSEEGTDQSPAMLPNPAYQNLRTQLQQVNTEIGIREREKKWIEEEMTQYNSRVSSTPRVEQEISEVLRINTDLNKQHASLKEKLDQAKLAESAESSQKGTQFRILDRAYYPLAPAPPSRPIIFLVGLVISLGLGVAVAFVVDIASPVVFTQSELERVLQTKVLVEIPRITTPSDIRKNRITGIVYAGSFVALTGLYGGCLYFLYLKQNKLVQILEPVIQRLQG